MSFLRSRRGMMQICYCCPYTLAAAEAIWVWVDSMFSNRRWIFAAIFLPKRSTICRHQSLPFCPLRVSWSDRRGNTRLNSSGQLQFWIWAHASSKSAPGAYTSSLSIASRFAASPTSSSWASSSLIRTVPRWFPRGGGRVSRHGRGHSNRSWVNYKIFTCYWFDSNQ